MKRTVLGFVLGVSLVAATVWSQSTGPDRVVPYQGSLNLNGVVVEGATALEFFLVETPTGAYGDAIWAEVHPSVIVSGGRFSVQLGSIAPLNASDLARPNVYVGIIVNGVTLDGRQPLLPAPYAVDSLGTPPGTVVAFAGVTPPAGWLVCDGSEVSQTLYPRLFASVGATYGAAAAGQFRVPDLRGRAPVGLDAGANRVTAAGAQTLGAAGGIEQTTQVLRHGHPLGGADAFPDSCNQGTTCGDGNDGFVRGPRNENTSGWVTGNTSNTGTLTALDNMPPFMGLHYIVKY